jgi:CheY-like chemotaxis protein
VSAIFDRTFPSTATSATSFRSGVAPGILYLDDDAMIRDIYGEVLLEAGYNVDLAEDGHAGWEALQRKKYELLITDHDMPQLTGLELAVRVRGAGIALPIIIASSSAWLTNDDAYAWLRLSSSLQKPFTLENSSRPWRQFCSPPYRALTDKGNDSIGARVLGRSKAGLARIVAPSKSCVCANRSARLFGHSIEPSGFVRVGHIRVGRIRHR